MTRAHVVLLLPLLVVTAAGAQDAAYRVQGPQLPIAVSRNGYQQTVVPDAAGGVLVRVATDLGPVGSTGSYRGVKGAPGEWVPRDFRMPRQLIPALDPDASAWRVATDVLRFAAKRLEVAPHDRAPQDAASVLRRGRGRCSGVANATVALLLAAGFEARTVSGVLVGDERVVAHRWLECRLPGAGWVPTDPTLGLWVVTPRHLVFAAPVGELPRVRVVTAPADVLSQLPLVDGRPARSGQGAELVCRVVNGGKGALVELDGPGGDTRRLWAAPQARVAGLAPGRWRIAATSGGEVSRMVVMLEDGGSHAVVLRLPPPVGVPSVPRVSEDKTSLLP